MNLSLVLSQQEKLLIYLVILKKILKIDVDNCIYESMRGDEYLRRKVLDERCFRKIKDERANTILNEKNNYNYRVLLQIQLVYYSNKDVIEDINIILKYY